MRSSSRNGVADFLRGPALFLGLASAFFVGSAVSSTAALAESPVAAYSFNEGEGKTAYDSTGSHDGEVEGIWTEAGKYGGAIDFNGMGNRVEIPDDNELDFTDSFTLEAWVRPEKYREWASLFSKAGPEEPDYGFMVYTGNGEGPPKASIRDEEGEEAEVEGGEELPLNTWSHIAATSDGEDLRFYIDGDLVDTQPTVIADVNSYPIRIGGLWDWWEFFDGKIDEVRLYDEALSEEEIEDDMSAAIKSPPPPVSAPVAAYAFDEGTGKTLHDDTGNGNDGEIDGGEWVAGKFGSSLKFDGEAEDCVSIPDSPELQLDDEFTLEVWARPEGTNGSEPLIYKETESSFSYALYLGVFNGGTEGLLRYEPEPDLYIELGGEKLPTEKWSSLAFTYNEEDLRLYIDGKLVDATESLDAISSEGDLSIGCSKNFGDEFTGLIDNIRIYDRALRAEELEEDEKVGVGMPHSDPWFGGSPTIDGQAEEGQTLTVNLSTLRGTVPFTIDYEWQRCYLTCEVISEAESETYTTVAADVAKQLRVKVTVSNETGEASAWSHPTTSIASTEEEGKPVLSSPPRIGGLFRATEEVAATAGEWMGETPIETDLEWERCEPSGESCEEIEGATEQVYEVTEADEGSRLRVKTTATNESGSESTTSQLSKVVQPEKNTTFAFDLGVDLEEVEEVVDENELRWLSVTYGGESTGIYRIPSGAPNAVSALSTLIGKSAAGFPVSTIELAGEVETGSLGSLEDDVDTRETGPSLRYSNPPPKKPPFPGLDTFTEGIFREAFLASAEDTNDSFMSGVPLLDGFDRVLYSYFRWHPTQEEMAEAITESGKQLAMEFDLRQINGGNVDLDIDLPGLPAFQVHCFPWEENNFWLGTREPVLIETDIPGDAGIYWDVGNEDACSEKDLTYGIYNPEVLEGEEEYTTIVYFDGGDADGDTDYSSIEWSAQLWETICDFSPWCVNLGLPLIGSIEGSSFPIISYGQFFDFPESPSPREAVLPGCWRFWNPMYEVPSGHMSGANHCYEIS